MGNLGFVIANIGVPPFEPMYVAPASAVVPSVEDCDAVV
jgi:hypothetical protein